MAYKVFTKQPRDSLDYDILLEDWMTEGDTVQTIEVITPEGIELVASVIEGDVVKLWIRGGTSGENYKFTVLINTINRTKEVEFLMVVNDF